MAIYFWICCLHWYDEYDASNEAAAAAIVFVALSDQVETESKQKLEILTASTIINNHHFAFNFNNFDKCVYEFVRTLSVFDKS